jgi:hypothetical protein
LKLLPLKEKGMAGSHSQIKKVFNVKSGMEYTIYLPNFTLKTSSPKTGKKGGKTPLSEL